MNQGVHNGKGLEDTKRRFVEPISTKQMIILKFAFIKHLSLHLTKYTFQNKHHHLFIYKSNEE